MATSFVLIDIQANCCNALFSCCCQICVCLSAVTLSNTLYIAVNHRLIRPIVGVQRSAVVRCAEFLFLYFFIYHFLLFLIFLHSIYLVSFSPVTTWYSIIFNIREYNPLVTFKRKIIYVHRLILVCMYVCMYVCGFISRNPYSLSSHEARP